MAKRTTRMCPTCQTGADGHDTCPSCGMHIGSSGLKVEGTHYLQVLAVAASLIVLLFALAVAWRYLFG